MGVLTTELENIPGVGGAGSIGEINTASTNPISGADNVIVAGPPAGFIRRCGFISGLEPAVGCFNVSGTTVGWSLLVNGIDVGGVASQANDSFQSSQGSWWLEPGQDLTMDYDSGGGGSGMRFNIPYQDFPTPEFGLTNIVLTTAITTIVPAAAAGRAHDLVGAGEDSGLKVLNTSLSSALVQLLQAGVGIDSQKNITAGNDLFGSLLDGGYAVTTQDLQIQAGTASAFLCQVAYRDVVAAA